MSVVVRVTSIDNTKAFTRQIDGEAVKVELPRDAKFVVIDEVTGEVIAVRPKSVRNENGQDELIFVAGKDGEEIEIALETSDSWPLDVAPTNAGLTAPENSVQTVELGEFAREGAAGKDVFESLGEGVGATGLIIGGLIAIGTIVTIALDETEDEEEPSDMVAPLEPQAPDLDDASDANGDNIVAPGTGLIFTGLVEADATVEIFADGVSFGTVAAGSDGAFSISVDLPEGTNSITVTATDASGNTSFASAPLDVIVDLTAPAAPTALDLAAADDNGNSDADNVTSQNNSLSISGTAEAGSSIELFNGTTSLGTGTANGDGAFAIDVTLPAGTTSITAVASDAAGNSSSASAALNVTVDQTAPAVPTALDLADASDTGAANNDNLTGIGQGLTVTGTAEAGSIITLSGGGMVLGTATAGMDGNFTSVIALPDGTTSVTATAADEFGNTSAASNALDITVDTSAPAAPADLDFAADDDTGTANDDDITDQTNDLTVSGTAEVGSVVEVFANGVSQGVVMLDDTGAFGIDLDLPQDDNVITATATDEFGRTSQVAELTITVGRAPQVQNATIDADGDVVTVYFDELIDPASAPMASQFAFTDGDDNVLANVVDFEITGTRVTLYLDTAIEAGARIAYTAAPGTVTDLAGNAAPDLAPLAIQNDLSVAQSDAITFGKQGQILLDGAEIVAFDPGSDRFFVTSGDGLQVLSVDENLNMTLLGVVELGTNDITSVAVSNGLVAVAVASDPKQDPGTVFILEAGALVSQSMIINSVAVGALPDMVTFTPDGTKILTANEGERTEVDDVEDGATLVDPEGSISIIDLTQGSLLPVTTATFTAFNDQIDSLVAEGLRTFAGTPGNEMLTLAQDLEPEYIAISPDGTEATITLQEANAVAILDIEAGEITDIQPLGLKPFENLNFDFSDRDDEVNLGGFDAANVFGQFMPDTIASFVGGDGATYYVIANEGDARDDFFDGPDGRVDDLNLDPTTFPDAGSLQNDENLGRLEVTIQEGLNGDTDGDGDIDQILAYGGRSFSILNEDGVIIYDSGSHIEEFAASQGEFISDDFPNTGVLDDGRSDAKGPEPEAITTGVFGDSVLAFVGLERGGGGIMVYDVTDPANVTFVSYLRAPNTLAPEGLVYVPADDSPTGQPILAVASEGDDPRDDDEGMGLTVFEIAPEGVYTLQLLHFADAEAKSLAIDTAPNLAALVDAFEDQYVNSITLSGGDNYIPGLFFDAQSNQLIEDTLGYSGGPKVDIAIHNAIGIQASTVGNHEFDKGTANFASAISADGDYEGALFPYLSANLDYSGDANLAPLFTETLGDDLDFATDLNNTLAPSAIIEEGGELIGLVGATTQLLGNLTSAGGVIVDGVAENDMAALADQLQDYIDDMIAQGVNKIIVMSHLQNIELEEALAPLLEGVDIILAAGSNTRLSDDNDVLDTFDGARPAESQGDYPIVTQGADGGTTLIVNTDSEYTYLGRLVVDFDADGNIILDSLDDTVNGVTASTDENVADVYDVEATDNFTITTQGGTISAEAVTAALAGNAYVNIHSTDNPGGEIRGQLELVQDNRNEDGNGTVVLGVELSGENEVPAVDTDAFGDGRVIVLARDGVFTYNSEYTVYNFDSASMLDSPGAHIHEGTEGENGPIVENILADDGTVVEDFDFNFLDTAYAEGTRGGEVNELVGLIDDVIAAQLTNVIGFSDVFLEGNRVPGVRTQETNLGNLTADANVAAARAALENEGQDATYVVAIKNGGGIRDSVGQDEVVGDTVTRVPNDEGVIAQTDIASVLAFNNGLVVFQATPQELLNLLNSPNTFRFANGGFLQTSGLQVSYEYDLADGEEVDSTTNFTVIDVALIDDDGNKVALVDDGVIAAGAPASINIVGLDFTASRDGDGYEVAENGDNFRYIIEDDMGDLGLSDPLAEVQEGGAPVGDLVVDTGSFGGDPYGEQAALEAFLLANHATPETAFDQEDTDQDQDERIQNVDERTDTVLDDAAGLIITTGLTQDMALVPALAENFA